MGAHNSEHRSCAHSRTTWTARSRSSTWFQESLAFELCSMLCSECLALCTSEKMAAGCRWLHPAQATTYLMLRPFMEAIATGFPHSKKKRRQMWLYFTFFILCPFISSYKLIQFNDPSKQLPARGDRTCCPPAFVERILERSRRGIWRAGLKPVGCRTSTKFQMQNLGLEWFPGYDIAVIMHAPMDLPWLCGLRDLSSAWRIYFQSSISSWLTAWCPSQMSSQAPSEIIVGPKTNPPA